jgi:hypothetical protein
MFTATATASKSLQAEVLVTGTAPGDNRFHVQVISGIGGWATPGKKLVVDGKILSNIHDAFNVRTIG